MFVESFYLSRLRSLTKAQIRRAIGRPSPPACQLLRAYKYMYIDGIHTAKYIDGIHIAKYADGIDIAKYVDGIDIAKYKYI